VYANDAAARLSGYPTVESMLAGQAEAALARFALLDEAGKPFAPERLPGPVDVAVGLGRGEHNDTAVLTIRDSGLGIPAEDVTNVFDRFHRATNVRGRITGTGVGLASARSIIEAHGGTIDVESQQGFGSTFTVRLPLSVGDRDASRTPRSHGGAV
jgi:signal transduction histidine kinase